MKTVLIIDDEEKLRGLLSRIIRGEGFQVVEAGDIKSGIRKTEQHDIDVVLCDVKLPDGSGLNLVEQLKARSPLLEIILLTAYGNIPDGVQAMKNGAFDYIVKGDDNDKIIPLLNRAMEKVTLLKRVKELEQKVGKKYSFQSIIGHSKTLNEAITLAKKVAPTDAAVLLTGETGTGKEVFAQAIHQGSTRSGKNFVALNCSALGKDILESELFGYKQGAFTGAAKDKKGLIEEAHGGTLFLDEIGEMPLDRQAKLLRVLETSEFIKLGDTRPQQSDFRLIAATNKDLKAESEAHLFRSDLYFRLNVFQIQLPPLRERVKDIEALAVFYTRQFTAKTDGQEKHFAPGFIEKLEAYAWPGNIRELKNVIERAVILSERNELSLASLPFEIQEAGPAAGKTQLSAFSLMSAEKLHIQKVLNHTRGNKAEAARLLEIGIATLYRKLEEYKIQ